MREDDSLVFLSFDFELKNLTEEPKIRLIEVLKRHNLQVSLLETNKGIKLTKSVEEWEKIICDKEVYYGHMILKGKFLDSKGIVKDLLSALRMRFAYSTSDNNKKIFHMIIKLEDDIFLPIDCNKNKNIKKALLNCEKLLNLINDIRRTFPSIIYEDVNTDTSDIRQIQEELTLYQLLNPRYMLKIQEEWDEEKWKEFANFVKKYKEYIRYIINFAKIEDYGQKIN